jgi:hypothetical protein
VRFIDSTDVVNAWMASPTHRANIVKPVYTEIGVGVAEGTYQGQPATYVVQYFGAPKAAVSTSASPQKPKNTNPSQPAAVQTAQLIATTNPQPAVEGAQAPSGAEVQSNSFTQQVVKQLLRAFGDPVSAATTSLSLTVLLLVIGLLAAFFMHYQIQHPTMLAAGAFVAFLAIFFLALNSHLVGGAPGARQSASVIGSQSGVIVPTDGAEQGYAIFPN